MKILVHFTYDSKAGEQSLTDHSSEVSPGDLCQIWPPPSTSNRNHCDSCFSVVGHLAADVIKICSSQGLKSVFTVPLWGQSAIDKLVKRVGDFSNILTLKTISCLADLVLM